MRVVLSQCSNSILCTARIIETIQLKHVEEYIDQTEQDYIDLVLLHFPSISAFGPLMSSPCSKEGKSAKECRVETWKALSELQASGKIRNAGVSNFAVKHLQELEGIGVPIANNQIQFNPFEPEYVVETFEYCAAKGITITAYSPLGGLMDRSKAEANEILTKMAEKYGRRLTSIMLRWAIQRGCAVIPGTGNPCEFYAFVFFSTQIQHADLFFFAQHT